MQIWFAKLSRYIFTIFYRLSLQQHALLFNAGMAWKTQYIMCTWIVLLYIVDLLQTFWIIYNNHVTRFHFHLGKSLLVYSVICFDDGWHTKHTTKYNIISALWDNLLNFLEQFLLNPTIFQRNNRNVFNVKVRID